MHRQVESAKDSAASSRLRRILRGGSGFDRAIVLVVIVVIACVWIATIDRVRFEAADVEEDTWREATNLAIAAEQHALRTLEDIERTVAIVAHDYERHGERTSLRELLGSSEFPSTLYNLFIVTDEHGEFIEGSRPILPTNVADRDYFRFHRDNADTKEANGRLAAMLGYSCDEMVGLRVADIVPREELSAALDARDKLRAGGLDCSLKEFHYVRKDGSLGYALRTLSPVRDGSGNIEYFITVVQDISERKQAEAALKASNEQFEQLVNHIPEVFWIIDVETNGLVYLSPAYERLCGVRFDSLASASRSWLDTVHADDRARAAVAVRNLKKDVLDQRFRIVRPDGAVRWIQVRGFPVRDASGAVYRIAGTLEDMTERQQLVDRLEYQAHYDALTGLPNRVLFVDRLKQTLGQAKRKRWLAAVLFLDLDRFKLVNDTLGHLFGEQLLQQVSRRLSVCVRASDTIGRLGGDEFAVVLAELVNRRMPAWSGRR